MMLKTKSSMVVLMGLSLSLVGCSSDDKSKVSDAVEDSGMSMPSVPTLSASSDAGTAGPLQTVYFGYDSSGLSGDSKSTLDNNSKYLKLTGAIDIQIEGHCDERGGQQYNLALGEKRARTVKDYLVGTGVDAGRLSIISYGKEKPLEFGHEDASWSKNRRANFVVNVK